MNNDKRPIPKDDPIFDQFYDLKSVSSSTEMTGLTPTPPLSEENAEAYSEIHGMPIPDELPERTKKKRK